ncbi:Pre-mRNA-processing protein [Penicillium frequentans]|uniref:Pre-mRNA-processing protein 45 n=1 Tax=Penicillium frequentans TaxID=3151616 RepID=A0AAD6CLZ7_9EURO|nr:Pre-mRNA-processing protein [Penicillium glabrum]
MASLASGLFKSLPKPKYTGEEEEIPKHAQPRGPRVVGADHQLDQTQVVLRKTGPPPYGNRTGWRPRAPEDFGDGGAFPEILVAQYPLDMGRKGTPSTSNALAVQVDAEGKVKYDAIARRGHSDNHIVHASFKDLIPLRQRVDMGEISLDRPSEEDVQAQMERTKNALASLVDGAVSAQKPKNVKGGSRAEPTFVRYTPANQMGDNNSKNDRIMKIVDRQQDPMEPPKFKHKKIPRGPPSPPPPVMHSPTRKLTAEDQEAWKIPPPVSNWKNPKGYTVPLDKRLAADGRGLQDVSINDNSLKLCSQLIATLVREVQLRAQMQQKLAEKEKAQKEEHLRQLAQKAREERAGPSRRDSRPRSRSRSASRSVSSYSSRSGSPSEDESAARERERERRERRQENERQLRQSRMGTERRIQAMAREQNRDISEKVALGLAKPTQSSESMWDSRLFNQTSGMNAGFNEDNPYDKPLFAAQDAINSIYRPRAQADADDQEGDEGEMSKIQKTNRFEVLGRAKEGFRGAADAEERQGPVQFEKDTADPFGIDSMIADVTTGQKRYGIQEAEEEDRGSKRARVDDD